MSKHKDQLETKLQDEIKASSTSITNGLTNLIGNINSKVTPPTTANTSTTGKYSFEIKSGLISSVFESKGSLLKTEKIDSNESYTLQTDGSVLKKEIEKTGIETTLFVDSDKDGFFDKVDHSWIAKATQSLGQTAQKIQKGWYEVSGNSTDFNLVSEKGLKSLVSNKGTDTESIDDATRVLFADKGLAFGAEAETVAKLLGAVFGTQAVANKEYAGIGLSMLDSGMSRDDLADLAAKAAGLDDHREVVSTLWSNLFHKEGSGNELNPYIDMLDHGMSVSALVLLAADTDINTNNINLVGIRQEGLEFHG